MLQQSPSHPPRTIEHMSGGRERDPVMNGDTNARLDKLEARADRIERLLERLISLREGDVPPARSDRTAPRVR